MNCFIIIILYRYNCVYLMIYQCIIIIGIPIVTVSPKSLNKPVGSRVTFYCNGRGLKPLIYSWEQRSGGSWTTIQNAGKFFTPSTSLPAGQYVYRCIVSNPGGPVPSHKVFLNFYGECVLL